MDEVRRVEDLGGWLPLPARRADALDVQAQRTPAEQPMSAELAMYGMRNTSGQRGDPVT